MMSEEEIFQRPTRLSRTLLRTCTPVANRSSSMGLERPRQSLNTLQLVSKRAYVGRSAASDVISGPVAENKAVTDVSSQLRRTSVSLSSPPLKPLKEEVGRCAIEIKSSAETNHSQSSVSTTASAFSLLRCPRGSRRIQHLFYLRVHGHEGTNETRASNPIRVRVRISTLVFFAVGGNTG